MPYTGYTKEQNLATQKYKASHYKRIPLDVPNAEYEALKAYTDEHGETVNGFLRRIIKEKIAE